MRLIIIILSVLVGLSACGSQLQATKPKPRPEVLTPVGPSIKSQQISAYYASIQARLLAKGYLRQEILPSDAPFTADDLAKDFERIALFEEYSRHNGKYIAQETPSILLKWDRPIRIGLIFGPSVSKEQRKTDTSHVRSFARQLARLTGLDIRLTTAKSANFSVLFLSRDEQGDYAQGLSEELEHFTPEIQAEIKSMPRGIYCAAYSSYYNLEDEAPIKGIWGAVLLIKNEHKGLFRKSCIHEEMAQALGLTNDSPDARPSIFNDDEEFALLTRHDEFLLRMLYDPRLKIGMDIETARPIIEQITHELVPDSQS